MKQFFLLLILFFCIATVGFSQGKGSSWEKAINCGCYFQTNPGARFNWSGGTSNGYCNGYGTIQWYDTDGYQSSKYVGNLKNGKADGYATQYNVNGNISYQGYWKDDMMHGKGTRYHSDGTVLYKGIFEKDKFKPLGWLKMEASQATDTIVKKVFFGGTNVQRTITKAVINDDESIHELWIDISFNGNINRENEYYFTLKYNEDWTVPVDFFDYSKNCEPYFVALVLGPVIDEIVQYFRQ